MNANPPTALRNTLGRRLLMTLSVVLFFTLTCALIGYWSLISVNRATEVALQDNVSTERLVADAYRLQAINIERFKAMALSSEPDVAEILKADVQSTQQAYENLLKQLVQRSSTNSDKELLGRINGSGKDFQGAVTELIAARDSGLTERIRKVFAERFQPSAAALLQALANLATAQHQQIDAQAQHITELSLSARLALAVFSLCALLAGSALTWWLVRSISRPIRLASETADRVSKLDLRREIQGHERDEAGQMLLSLSAMQQALRNLVLQVRQSAQSVRLAASEIATGNGDLSQRTEDTASSLQQTAAALEQVTHNLHHSTQSATQAEQMANNAALVAVQGGQVVGQVVSTMQDINQSSRRVVDIIGVIDAIAFQTNILALNAAVEAARAGEAGRGFAVVAAEVRQLATRSAAAAKEIKQLIAASVERVEAGTQLVDNAGQTMQRIVDAIQDVATTIAEISQATHAQTRDIGQINTAVSRLDQMTQQNSALVEESAAASEGLSHQAQVLASLISQFVLPEGHTQVESTQTYQQLLSA